MTRAQILALPSQTRNRLIKATDANQLYVILKGTAGAAAIPVGVGTNNIIDVADKAARKTVATYDATGGPVAGTTKVRQADVDDAMFLLIDDDVTADASWIAVKITTDPDGVFA